MKMNKILTVMATIGFAFSSLNVMANAETDALKQEEMQLKLKLQENMKKQQEQIALEQKLKMERIKEVKNNIYELAKSKRLEEINALTVKISQRKSEIEDIRKREQEPLKAIELEIKKAQENYEVEAKKYKDQENSVQSELERLNKVLNAIMIKQKETDIDYKETSKKLKDAYNKELRILRKQPNLEKISTMEQENLNAASRISKISLDDNLPAYIIENWDFLKKEIPADIDPNELELDLGQKDKHGRRWTESKKN